MRSLVGYLVLLCALPVRAQTQELKPLSIEAALAEPEFQPYGPLLISPDGQWIAYTLILPSRVQRTPVESWFTTSGVPSTAVGAQVRITELRTGHTLLVGSDSATNWAPSWSPDGRFLAFYSDVGGVARLWVRETATGRTRRLSDAIVRAHRAIQYPRWTPDSRRIVMPGLRYGTTLPEAKPDAAGREGKPTSVSDTATVTVLRADPAHPYGGQATDVKATDIHESLHADLLLVDEADGHVTTLAANRWPNEYAVSSNGKFVAFTSEYPPTMTPRWTVPYDVIIVPLEAHGAGPEHVVASKVAITNYSVGMFWSPTSTTLAYSATDTAGREQYYVVGSSDWRPRQVAGSGAADLRADTIAASRRSLWWDETGRSLHIMSVHGVATVSMPDGVVRSFARAPRGRGLMMMAGPQSNQSATSHDGRELLVAFRNDSTKAMGFASLDVGTGAWRTLREGNYHHGERWDLPVDVAKDGRVAFLSEDAQHPADVWIAEPRFAWARQLTHTSPEMVGIAFGQSRLIEYRTASGARRRATLLLPAGYRPGQRYPLVVYPYPILDRSDNVNVFGVTGTGVENMQLLATRGIAVLAPDVAPFDWTDEMRQLPLMIMPGVDRAIELGIADSTRLGIMGQSWGGYTVLAVIAQTTRFAAAVMRGGMGDQVAMTGALQASGFAYGVQLQEMKFGGTLWERKDIYLKNSPIYLFDRIRTPLLIIHGTGETTVPIYLADEVFASLQRLGREVEYARYEHENHNESQWSYLNQRDDLRRTIEWFESHLKNRAEERTSRAEHAPNPR